MCYLNFSWVITKCRVTRSNIKWVFGWTVFRGIGGFCSLTRHAYLNDTVSLCSCTCPASRATPLWFNSLLLDGWRSTVFTGMLTSLTNSVSQSVTAASLSPQRPASSVAFKRRLVFLVFVLCVQWLVQDSPVSEFSPSMGLVWIDVCSWLCCMNLSQCWPFTWLGFG